MQNIETHRIQQAIEIPVFCKKRITMSSNGEPSSPVVVQATEQQVHDAKIPMAYRDHCVDSLILLNECRRKNFYLPWKCEHERHAYELCQYKEYKKRVAQKRGD